MTQDDTIYPIDPDQPGDVTQSMDPTRLYSTAPYPQEALLLPQDGLYTVQPDAPTQFVGPVPQGSFPAHNNMYPSHNWASGAQMAGNGNAETIFPPNQPVQKRRQSRNKLLLSGGILLCILILLCIAGAWLLPSLFSGGTSSTAGTPVASASPVATTPPARKNIYAPYLTSDGASIRTQIAQGLHLTPTQLAAQLHSGKTLSAIATTQGVSASQLQTLVTNSFQSGLKSAVANGGLTQKQVSALAKRMLKQPKTLAHFLEIRTTATVTSASNT